MAVWMLFENCYMSIALRLSDQPYSQRSVMAATSMLSIRFFRECGYVFNEHLDIYKDLKLTRDELWESLRSGARTNIRRAKKSGVRVREIHDREELKSVYSLIRSTYHRVQVSMPMQALFESAFDILYPKNMIKVLMATIDSTDIGTLVLLLFKDEILCWYTGSLRQYSRYRALDLLFWHAMDWGIANGFCKLDLGGAGRPDREYGVRQFKAKFGDEIVNHGRYIWIRMPRVYKLFNKCYQIARSLNLTHANLFLPSMVK
jgi:serine/alanine adding enzyme